MVGAALSVLAALVVGARAAYPRILERRARRRLELGAEGIVDGAAPIDLFRDGAPGVLLLHGGGDTPQVLAELAAHLHAAGLSVRAPLLSGHGRDLSALTTTSSKDWHAEAVREYDRMRVKHRWVAVVGLSMGGALAVKLASKRQDIPALVLLAPYVVMPRALRSLAATSIIWGWLLPYFSSLGGRSIHDPSAAERGRSHGILTPQFLRALYETAMEAASALPHVQAPTLVIQSREDNRISAASAQEAFERLGSSQKQFIWVEGAGHVITVDYGRQRVFDLTADWLVKHQSAGLLKKES
jgi:carboxylesterase